MAELRPLELAVDALAAYRLTRLVTADTITTELRGRVISWAYQREHGAAGLNDYLISHGMADTALQADFWDDVVAMDDEPPKLAELVHCRWCAGMWISAAVVAARRVAPRWWTPAATVLSLSAAAALLARLED